MRHANKTGKARRWEDILSRSIYLLILTRSFFRLCRKENSVSARSAISEWPNAARLSIMRNGYEGCLLGRGLTARRRADGFHRQRIAQGQVRQLPARQLCQFHRVIGVAEQDLILLADDEDDQLVGRQILLCHAEHVV